MKESERLQCPLCGWIRPINFGWSAKKGEKREVRFDKIDLEKAFIWRKEQLKGSGRGSKEAKIEIIEAKRLNELPSELKKQIKDQAEKILKILI